MEVTRKAALARKGRVYSSDSNAQFDFGCLAKMFKERRFCDVILEVDDKEIAAHKVVLSVSSSYFYWKLSREARIGHLNRVKIPNINYETLSAIVEYFYTSKVCITLNNVEWLLSAAVTYVLTDIQEACWNFLRDVLDKANCVKVMNLSRKYQRQELLSLAFDYVTDYFGEVIKSGDFLDISHEQFANLIATDRTNAAEEDILGCVLAWAREDLQNRQEHVYSLLHSIRFPLMPLTSVLTALGNDEWIMAVPRCSLFLIDVLKHYSLKEQTMFPRQPRISIDCLAVVGRRDNGSLHMESYDLQKKAWQSVLQTFGSKEFTFNCSCTISGSNIYCDNFLDLHTIDITNPLGTWTKCEELRLSGNDCNLVCDNNRIYVIGGCSRESVGFYDEVFGKWGEMPPMSTIRKLPGLAVLKGKLYSIGGYDSNAVSLSSVECYDPAFNSWTNLPNMFNRRSWPGAAALDNKLFVAGGSSNGTCLKSAEIFDLLSLSWKKLPNMKIARNCRPGVIVVNGFVYVVGGWNKKQEYLNSVEMYDLKANVWTMLESPMSIGKSRVAVTLMNKAELKRVSDAKKYHTYL